jgi:hypothetical protein
VLSTPLLTGGSKIASFSPLPILGQTVPPALCSSCGKLPLLEQVHHSSSCGKPHHLGLVHHCSSWRPRCWTTPQPHPSHLPIPGKPHYHIWGSTSHVHPQGALLGLVLAWALISYLCGTPLSLMGLVHHLCTPCTPLFSCGRCLLLDQALCPLPHLPSFWTLAYLYGHGPYPGPSSRGAPLLLPLGPLQC